MNITSFTYADIVKVKIHEAVRSFDQILLKGLALVVQTLVRPKAFDPSALVVRTRNANDF